VDPERSAHAVYSETAARANPTAPARVEIQALPVASASPEARPTSGTRPRDARTELWPGTPGCPTVRSNRRVGAWRWTPSWGPSRNRWYEASACRTIELPQDGGRPLGLYLNWILGGESTPDPRISSAKKDRRYRLVAGSNRALSLPGGEPTGRQRRPNNLDSHPPDVLMISIRFPPPWAGKSPPNAGGFRHWSNRSAPRGRCGWHSQPRGAPWSGRTHR
jgi:hypothetical protein